MNFIQEFPILDESTVDSIIKYLKEDQGEFSDSLVYNSKIDEKLHLPEERLSVFKVLSDAKLFDMCDILLTKINDRNRGQKFSLFRNNVTYIKYSEGGYFKAHEDYLSITSNMIEEYTLLMCIDAPVNDPCSGVNNLIGGETILHLNESFTYASRSSITPGHILLFRKDIQHEGALIEKGFKEIMSLNLWCIKDDCNDILVVKFQNDIRTHVINIADIEKYEDTQNVLNYFVMFERKKSPDQKIFVYNEKEYNYDQFQIISDIYAGICLSYHDLMNYRDIVDYFCFKWMHLLVKRTPLISGQSPGEIVKQYSFDGQTEDLIMFGDQTRYVEFLHTIKEYDLPYIPMQIVFVEGMMGYAGGLSGNDPTYYQMSPVFCTVSERNNLLFCNNLVGTSNCVSETYNVDTSPLSAYINIPEEIEKYKALKDEDVLYFSGSDDYDPEDGIIFVEHDNPSYCGFRGTCINTQLDGCINDFSAFNTTDYLCDPDTFISPELFFNDPQDVLKENDSFVIDKDNRLAIRRSDRISILHRIKEVDVFNKIKSRMSEGNLNFKITQQIKNSVEHNFCNEDIYGNFNFLTVYAFIKFDEHNKRYEVTDDFSEDI